MNSPKSPYCPIINNNQNFNFMTTPKFIVQNSTDGKRYFYLMAENSEVVFTSEIYESKQATIKGIISVMNNAPNPKNFEIKTSLDDKPYFVLKAQNKKIIGVSETYNSRQAAENGILAVQRAANIAQIIDRT